ncbi:cell cycle transcriptional regulator TrcR [Longimycelium tulufanense]|nr:cell cycle transcriptional regulator TrcR [Longimycelium tulufanense]
MRVVDGVHRVHAAITRGEKYVQADFFDGDEHEAFVRAVELNAMHGLPLAQGDRLAAAARIVMSHPQWSDRAIAKLTGTSARTVSAIRRRATADLPQLNTRMGRDSRVRPLSTAVGRESAAQLFTERPEAGLREIARDAGISVGTARDVRARLHRGEDPVPPRERRGQALLQGAERESEPRPRQVVNETFKQALHGLMQDPSVRQTDAGRHLLRLLHAHSLPETEWSRLVEAIPAHAQDIVADMARSCANSWLRLAAAVCQKHLQAH